jgi:hypothetical protein
MYIIDMIMEIKFIIQKYSETFNRAGTCCREVSNFMLIDQHVGFSYNSKNKK